MNMRRLMRGYLSPLILCILFLAACSIPEMEIERTPMPKYDVTATVAVQVTENARLSTQKATVAAPTPSPSPSRARDTYTDLALVYHLDGTIYCGDFLGAKAMPKAMLPEPLSPEALWSAQISGRFLAYVLGNRIMVTDLESGETHTLHSIERPNVMALNLVWSSERNALAYAASYDDLQAAFGSAVEVGVIDVETGESRVVTTLTEWAGAIVVGYNRASGEVWLIPQGQDPAFVEVHIYSVEQPGVSPRVLPVVGYGYAVAAPDLSHIAVMVDYEEQTLTKVYSLLDPTVPPLVLRHPNGTFGAHYLWSQRRLAYVALEGAPWGEQTGGADGIWIWEPEAMEPRRVAEAMGKDDTLIAWTPDGAWLLVRQTPPGGSPRYAVIPLEGGEPISLQVPSWAQVLGWTSTVLSAPVPTLYALIPGSVATYIDSEIGCALDYPVEWHIQATPGWLVVITSFDPAGAPGIGGVPPDKAKVDLVPDKPGQSKSLEELVAEVYIQARNPEVLEVLWEECWELAGNVPAVRMQVKGEAGGEMALLLTVINGRSLRLAGYGDTSLFDAIARTLRPTPTIAPGTTADVDCADVAPFALGCLDQPRPPGLAPDIAFVGILPAGLVQVAAWSPDSTHLAYAVANPKTGDFQGLEVLSLPDFRLEGRWAVQGIFDLTWTPDGQAVLFVFDRGDTSSIGLARLGETEWRDLLPGGKAVLAMSLGKDFVDWLGEDVLAFRVHCGTGCETLYSLDMVAGDLRPLVNAWGVPDAPYADVFATVYLFSPDHRWLAATSLGMGLPKALVLEWPGPAEPRDLSDLLGTSYTEAQSWTDGSLVFVCYPPGDPDTWVPTLNPDLCVWDANTGAIHHVASSAFRAVFAPTGDYLAAFFIGEPRVNEEGQIEVEGSTPHLGLLRWPEGELLAVHLVSTKGISDVFDLWRLPTPVWSPSGKALAFQPASSGLALMSRGGDVWPVLTGKVVNWVGWGAGGNLALLVGEQIWLVRGLVRVPDGGLRPYTDAVLGMALDIPAEWEVHGFQGVEAHVVALDTTGTPLGVLTFSVIGAFDTLDSTLAEVRRGAWGPYIHDVQPVHLGEFEARRLELTPGEDRPPVVWLVVTLSGLAVGFIPESHPALVESVLATLRAVPVREPWEIIVPTLSIPNDLESAREAVIAFFSLLHAQRYSEATNYYGGTYDILRDWNPMVARDDHATLFRNGCTMNGLRCLRIRAIMREEQVSATEFRFIVEFMNDDGTLFARGPCCSTTETEMPPQSQFPFTVKKVNNRFLVQDLPVYVP